MVKKFFSRYDFKTLIIRNLRVTRNFLIKNKYKKIDLLSNISPKATIFGASNISVGKHTVIHPYAILQATIWNTTTPPAGSIEIGNNCAIQSYSYIYSCGGNIKIGDYCSLNPFSILYGHGGLTIGNYVRIAAHTVIIPGNHGYADTEKPILYQRGAMLGINIEDDVWIGSGVRILDGVTIGKGCVIGAGSVVTKSTEPYGIYVGVPAKKIDSRKK